MSNSESHLLVDNLHSGVDVYQFPEMIRRGPYSFTPEAATRPWLFPFSWTGRFEGDRRVRPKQVAFGKLGELLLHGHNDGAVYMYMMPSQRPIYRLSVGRFDLPFFVLFWLIMDLNGRL
jgi:hypothetical protein